MSIISDQNKMIFKEELIYKFTLTNGLKETVKKIDFRQPKAGHNLGTYSHTFGKQIYVENHKIPIQKYNVADITDVFLNKNYSFEHKDCLLTTLSEALKRTVNQVIIDAITNVCENNINDIVDIGNKTKELTINTIKNAKYHLDINGFNENNTLLIAPSGLHSLVETSEANSYELESIRNYLRNNVDYINGFNTKVIPKSDETALPIHNRIQTHYAYNKSSIILVLDDKPEIKILWDEDHYAHKIIFSLYAGAKVVSKNGVVKISALEN